MNLRKTIAGAAVALGSTAVMLGLGGTAHASGVDVASAPNLDSGLDGIDALGSVDQQQVSSLLGQKEPVRTSNAEAGLNS